MPDETPAALKITRQSTADQVAALLRERIVRGELQPGTPLREVPLAASIGISRNTMREAIRVLVHEGLVRHNVHRGVTVTKLTDSDVADIYRVRRLLECAAVTRSTPESPQLPLLAESLESLDEATKAKNWPEMVEYDMLFHRRLVELLASKRLDDFYKNALAELRLGLMLVDRAAHATVKSYREHRGIYDQLVAGNNKEAAALLESHLVDAETLVLAELKQQSKSGQ